VNHENIEQIYSHWRRSERKNSDNVLLFDHSENRLIDTSTWILSIIISMFCIMHDVFNLLNVEYICLFTNNELDLIKIREINVAFFHSNLSLENQQSLINSFQDMKKNDCDLDILIETTEVLETDYILHCAFQVILMKLNYMIWMKQQTFFWISRYDQITKKTWAYQFYTLKFDVKRLIKDYQTWCQIFQNDTYDNNRVKKMNDEKE